MKKMKQGNFQTRWYDGYDGKCGVILSGLLDETGMKWLSEDINRLYCAQGPMPELSK